MKTLKNKQDQDLVNTLITLASTSSKQSIIPASKTGKPTVVTTVHEVLISDPYRYTQSELFHEVHINKLNKEHKNLKLERYKLQRSELCSLLGWGIHGDSEGRLALIAGDSKEYERLFLNSEVRKKKAYNK